MQFKKQNLSDMTFSIHTNNLDTLIETGFFLNICTQYSSEQISKINVVCKTKINSRILNNKPKTGHGYRLQSSFHKLADKINLTFVNDSALVDQLNVANDQAIKYVA